MTGLGATPRWQARTLVLRGLVLRGLARRRPATGVLAIGLLAVCLASPAHAADPEAWRSPLPAASKVVLVRGATVWTQGPEGILEDADLLVRDGKVAAVGRGLEAPAGAVIVDGRGKHVTPGIIDAHSHIAVDGQINEFSDVVTAQVRIADVLDPSDLSIYRQLAGGVTTSNILHGSANAIGGQLAVIKLRWGATAEELKLAGAPPGIKFALGENPKRSNFRRPGERRFPRTRPGVEEVLRQSFLAAREYQGEWQAYRAAPDRATRVPPRRDLQMEALLEILDGSLRVNAHSYRADEILMLLGVADDFGFRVAVLQHVLEGYKIADEIAAHGAGASTFSDWWAYKYEVIDAIPYNGAIMHQRGVSVSFNSDSDELGRRLPLEAAKAIRYGGLEPAEALSFVTLEPARQLGLEKRLGSLEVGKDADFVLWSGDPLSTFSRCEQTWIDGRRYFDREEDLAARPALEAERLALIAKVRATVKKDAPDAAEEGAMEDEGANPEAPGIEAPGIEGPGIEQPADQLPSGVDSPPPTGERR